MKITEQRSDMIMTFVTFNGYRYVSELSVLVYRCLHDLVPSTDQ